MKLIKTVKRNKKHLCLGVLLALLTSCSAIDENWDDCERDFKIRVKYSYNMLGADAFTTQIKSLCFYIFDESDTFIKKEIKHGPFSTNEFSFNLPDGKYKFVCIASSDNWDETSLYWNTPNGENSKFTSNDIKISLNGITNGIISSELPSLWYASPASPCNKEEYLNIKEFGKDTVELNLIRNTNNIRLIIQNSNNTRKGHEDYSCEINGATNSVLDYSDKVISHEIFTYRPYFQTTETINSEGIISNSNVFITEWDINRLMDNDKMRLTVKNKTTGKLIFDHALVPLLLMLQHEKYSNMPKQEYLDREYEYEFYLLLDNNDQWYQLVIKVNDWVLRLNRIDLN